MSKEATVVLNMEYTADAVRFQVQDGAVPGLPLSGWSAELTSALAERERWFALGEAWSSEIITEIAPGHYELPYTRYRELPRPIRSRLGLPEPERVRVEILTHSNAGDSAFRIEYRVRHQAHGRLDQLFPRTGPAFVIDPGTAVFLSTETEELFTPTVAMDPNGNAIAAWTRATPLTGTARSGSIWAARLAR